ncbi:ROK family protein [Leucobacter soli]|uniref:Glucokinase n=3 Tax=Leucobacter soli TaxID=2812850 RepID=A0A916JZ64_9MICO|nr:ROK family protein [Leucobacter soli]CAG7617659.1 Glucokinase [Leucobacter soli]
MTPTQPIVSDAKRAARIGMDIGGSKIAAVSLDEDARIEAEATLPVAMGAAGVLDTAAGLVAELAERTGRAPSDFASLGVGVPGQVQRPRGTVRHAYNLEIEEMELGELLSARTGIPVSVDNDVTAASIGAAHLMGLDGTIAYLNLGTGLAAGIIIDGRARRGANGVAGEIGHLPIDPLGRPCNCGQVGCLETVAGGMALRNHWPAGGADPGRRLLRAVEAGDDDARRAFDLLVSGTARAIRVLGLTIDPDTVVIGGGLRLLGAPLIDGIRRTLETWEAETSFFAQLGMSRRLHVLPEGSPAAAVGAALASRA